MRMFKAAAGTLVAVGVFAQSASKSPTRSGTQSPTHSVPSTSGCQDSFGPGFTGNSIEAVIKALKGSASSLAKSEFETTEQYKQRTARAAQTYVFLIPKAGNRPNVLTDETSVKYDADTSKLAVGLMNGGQDDHTDGTDFLAFDLVRYGMPTSSYIATNAFGVAKRVYRITETLYGLGLITADLFDEVAEQLGGPVEVTLSPDDARGVKPFVRLAAVVSSPLQVLEVHRHGEPKLAFPYEVSHTGYYLEMSVSRLVVFDSRSGKILKTDPECK